MEQFLDATFMKQLNLGSKFNMSYRLRVLLNEQIDLAKYGTGVQSILFSPIIGEVFPPKSTYSRRYRKLTVEFFLDPEKAVQATEEEFFYQMLDGLIEAIKAMKLPKKFDIEQFEEDLRKLKFEQVKPVV